MSKRDAKAAGWFALAAELAADNATNAVDTDVLAIQGDHS